MGGDGRAYVIADASVSGARPEGWARAVAAAAMVHGADRVVAEANNGGAMVESVLRAAEKALPVKLVHASRGKAARANDARRVARGARQRGRPRRVGARVRRPHREVHGRRGDRALFSVTSDLSARDWASAKLLYMRDFQVLATHIHDRVLGIEGHASETASLSPRELECLQWIAEGKTAWDYARENEALKGTDVYWELNERQYD